MLMNKIKAQLRNIFNRYIRKEKQIKRMLKNAVIYWINTNACSKPSFFFKTSASIFIIQCMIIFQLSVYWAVELILIDELRIYTLPTSLTF